MASRLTRRLTPRAITGSIALASGAAFGLVTVLLGLDRSSPAGIAHGSSWLIPALFAVGGVGLLAIGLRFAFASPITLAVGLLGVAFLLGLPSSGPWRGATPLAATWLLATAELSHWSLDLRVRGVDDPRIYRRRLVGIVGLAALGVVLGVTAEGGFNPIDLGGLELTALGLLAAVTLVGVAAAMAWRLRSEAIDASGLSDATHNR